MRFPQFTLRRLFLIVTLFACFSWLAANQPILLAMAFLAVCLFALLVVYAFVFTAGMLLLITFGEKAEERIERLFDRRKASQEIKIPNRSSP